ncbi:RNA polymerase sigma factor [Desmospora activa]|uniref:RNA polymerase sigma factor (Sigma-70 family) n=1 Tax=Desmospora activa DSM 45169 TaxID=1121389 RepID=A0A2T4ZDB0_9BACL|nr:sigma factor-like helix-turn-helix DNA-binding protein [Desmospora activa]PTM59867.1 RNA polymerase sigma factor (sigma-70 family) [Desmospora activa DSM 45169]
MVSISKSDKRIFATSPWLDRFLAVEEHRKRWDQVWTNPDPVRVEELERLFIHYVTGVQWRSYCMRRLRRRARDYLAQERRRRSRFPLLWDQAMDEDGNTWGANRPDPFALKPEEVGTGWNHPGLDMAWRQLTEQQQRTLLLHCRDGWTDTDIARFQGVSQQAVSRTRSRALRKIQRYMQSS